VKKGKTKKAKKIKFRYLCLILGALAYFFLRRGDHMPEEADEGELGFDEFNSFDDYY